jgi:hypothetical protein
MTTTATPVPSKKPFLSTLVLLFAPVLLLSGVIALFVFTKGAGLNVKPAAPIETLQFERTILRPGQIELHVRNTSRQEITIAQININDATWPYTISPGNTIARLGTAVLLLHYPWVQAEAYEITVFSSNSIPLKTSIPVATTTATASADTLWSFTLIGIYVGIIPVALGMFWLPALKSLGPRAMMFLMSATVGLLVYLGIDATTEALEVGGELGTAFQGAGIVGIGIIGTFLLLDVVGRQQMIVGRSEAGQRMTLATMIAVGIGLHNLGGTGHWRSLCGGRGGTWHLFSGRIHYSEYYRGAWDHCADFERQARNSLACFAGFDWRGTSHCGGLRRRSGLLPAAIGIVPGDRRGSRLPGRL